MKKIKKLTLFIIIAILIAVTAFFIGVNRVHQEIEPTITSELLKNRLESVQELTTTKYHYTNMGSFEKQNEFYGWKVPFTEKNFIVSYEGVINAGIELDKVNVEIDQNTINVTLPKARILSHEIYEDSLKVFDQKASIFNPIEVSDYSNFSKDQKVKVEDDAISKGLLNNAMQDTKNAISEVLNIDERVKEKYNINFVENTEN